MEMQMKVFIQKCLLPQLWAGAIVVMDNVPSHKVASIEPLIQSVGVSVLNMSPYSPDFNPIELWWSQQSSFFASILSNHNTHWLIFLLRRLLI